MSLLNEIESYLNQYLLVQSIHDYTPNGVQVRGRNNVERIITGVSACMDLFQAAQQKQADLILVHHGLIWNKESRIIEGNYQKRIKFLLQQDISLLAYHLPLDCHPQVGNNATILDGLGCNRVAPFGRYEGVVLSWLGELDEAIDFTTMMQRLQTFFGMFQGVTFAFGPAKIKRIAVCSGAAWDLIREAKTLGADLYLTGEASEPVYHFAKEENIHFVAVGHHKSESFGVQALGNHLAAMFHVKHCFIDIPNPL